MVLSRMLFEVVATVGRGWLEVVAVVVISYCGAYYSGSRGCDSC